MAVQNHPGLYQFGNERFNSTPSVNLYAQLQQRREAQRLAKEEAFSDYINNLNTKITPAGVRVADLPAFEEMKNKWQEFGLKNKTALQKNDIPTQTEFNRMYQGLVNLTMRSKAEEEKKKPYVEILVDPVKRAKTSSRLINDMQVHDEPLFVKNANGEWEENRNRKGLDLADNYFNPQFDFDKEFTGWSKGLERGKTYSDKPIKSDPQSGTVTFATEEKFAPEQIMQVANNAMKAIKSDGEGRNFYQHKLENIADDELKALNKAFQSVYGATTQYTFPNGNTVSGENVIDSPEELAAAEAIIQSQSMIKKGEELRLDKALANQRAQVNISLNKGGGATEPEVNDIYSKIDTALNNTKQAWYEDAPYLRINTLPVDAQKVVLDFARTVSGATGQEKGQKLLSNNNVKLKREKDGSIGIYDDDLERLIGTLPRVGTNLPVQADVKGKKEVIKQGEKSKKKDDPLNLFD